MRQNVLFASLCCIVFVCGYGAFNAEGQSPIASVPNEVHAVLEAHCIDCHSGDRAEAGIALDQILELDRETQLDTWNRIQEQIAFDLMPPSGAAELEAEEKQTLANWLRVELNRIGASRLDSKLRDPAYGNFVDHESLFSGEIQDAPFTPARRWLVSPQIFHQRVNDVFQLRGRERQKSFYGVTNPIILPDHSGVRYYDTAALDGGHLLVMLNNAQWLANKQLFAAQHAGVDRRKIEYPNPKDRWLPPRIPDAFVAFVNSPSVPSQDEMEAAVHAQYDCVLQRKANHEELEQHIGLMRSAIHKGGNVEALRQMLLSVLLKSEFMYRMEFGAGDADDYGRRLLSPREASYAIAYALTDEGPRQELREAASQGRLTTKEDYRREVNKILEDDDSYSGEVSPSVATGHIRPHRSTHPKLVRFFREFFGYPNSLKLFKDESRSGGFYDNAGRGYTGTAGSVANEADRVVDRILQEDTHVFERLLTTDEFFVLHQYSNEDGQRMVEGWQEAYAVFKSLDWESNTEEFILEHFDEYKELFERLRITNVKQDRMRVHVRDFKRFMEFFDNTIGKGITPITFPWFLHGGQKFRYSEIYSLPKIAGAGPLNDRGRYDVEVTWDYPVVQPFKVPHRKGILTHPAWLLAHSQNTETDPVRRGRWIREKLLAGQVPDVPITVDAQIPEDPHRTLRQRLDSVTSVESCWKCHRQMNPLGLPFEVFDDFGRFREEESLEYPENLIRKGNGTSSANVYKTLPVDATGMLIGTGDAELDGPVDDAFDLIDRLAKSDRARQSIIRHAFRFFLGRNELLSDSQTLIAAERAYLESGGSFKAVVVELLSSDSFRYRKDLSALNPEVRVVRDSSR